jgi:hypothetical protein
MIEVGEGGRGEGERSPEALAELRLNKHVSKIEPMFALSLYLISISVSHVCADRTRQSACSVHSFR